MLGPQYDRRMENLKSWKTWLFLVIAAIVEWAVVHFLDVAGTGVVSLWGKMIQIGTFGSQKYENLPYRMAATNPSPHDASLLMLLLLLGFGATLLFWRFALGALRPEFLDLQPKFTRRAVTWLAAHLTGTASVRGQALAFLLRYLVAFLLLWVLVISAGLQVSADGIRSCYEVDRDMVAPFMTDQQRLEIQSRFVQVETKTDFDKVMAELEDKAVQHNISLVRWP